MRYKVIIFAPDDSDLIDKIIEVAAKNGAGVIGNYTHTAWITKGMGNWKSEEGSHPTIGEVGKMSREPEVKIEMECTKGSLQLVVNAVKEIHPYETPVFDIFELTDL